MYRPTLIPPLASVIPLLRLPFASTVNLITRDNRLLLSNFTSYSPGCASSRKISGSRADPLVSQPATVLKSHSTRVQLTFSELLSASHVVPVLTSCLQLNCP